MNIDYVPVLSWKAPSPTPSDVYWREQFSLDRGADVDSSTKPMPPPRSAVAEKCLGANYQAFSIQKWDPFSSRRHSSNTSRAETTGSRYTTRARHGGGPQRSKLSFKKIAIVLTRRAQARCTGPLSQATKRSKLATSAPLLGPLSCTLVIRNDH